MAAITPANNPVHWNHSCEFDITTNKNGFLGGVWVELRYHNTKIEEVVTLNMQPDEALKIAVKLIEAARVETERRNVELESLSLR
jgi:hypothetical protein